MKREDYPADWPEEMIEDLENKPRWKPYLYPDGPDGLNKEPSQVAYSMYNDWFIAHDGLLKALRKIPNDTAGDADETLEGALISLQHALQHNLLDLDDIMNFVLWAHRADLPKPVCRSNESSLSPDDLQ